MKTNYLTLLMIIIALSGMITKVNAQVSGDLVFTGASSDASSGMWENANNWSISNGAGGYSGVSATIPTSANNVWIRSGSYVSNNGISNCKSLNVSGILKLNNTLNCDLDAVVNTGGSITTASTMQQFLCIGIGSGERTFSINGSTRNLKVKMSLNATKLTINGNGSAYLYSIQPDDVSSIQNQVIIIDANVTITGYITRGNLSSTYTRTFTVNEGKKLTLASGASFHFDKYKSPTGTGSVNNQTTYKGPDLTGYALVDDYTFGTKGTVKNQTDLSANFRPYGVAGTIVINNEWERYQPINENNHHLSDSTLELTAFADLGGFTYGGISSGQVVTKNTYLPTGSKTYMIQICAKIPRGDGVWPAFWLYSPGGAGTTASEIDVFEFWTSKTQNTFDMTPGDYGTGVSGQYYNIMSNIYVWHPGFDFASDYHLYTLIWKEGDIQKWVDNIQVKGTYFAWYGPAPTVILNLALGGGDRIDPNAAGTPMPCKYSIKYLRIYEKP